MEARNCKKCGRVFNYIGSTTPFCPACMKVLDEKYEEVKKYIYDNPGANINVVSAEMDVSVQQLRQWVKEERLSFAEGSMVGVDCERCGKMIRTGRYCQDCKSRVIGDLNRSISRPEPMKQPAKEHKDSSARMRFLQ